MNRESSLSLASIGSDSSQTTVSASRTLPTSQSITPSEQTTEALPYQVVNGILVEPNDFGPIGSGRPTSSQSTTSDPVTSESSTLILSPHRHANAQLVAGQPREGIDYYPLGEFPEFVRTHEPPFFVRRTTIEEMFERTLVPIMNDDGFRTSRCEYPAQNLPTYPGGHIIDPQYLRYLRHRLASVSNQLRRTFMIVAETTQLPQDWTFEQQYTTHFHMATADNKNIIRKLSTGASHD